MVGTTEEHPDARILVFAKAPVSGEVKTRLVPALGARAAADLHARLVQRTLDTAVTARVAPVELWCSPDDTHPFFRTLLLPRRIQRGRDLGQRMAHALQATLGNSRFAILIGTDCPALAADHLREAAGQLARGIDAVLGPAEDGGYVLIGLRRADPRLFEGVAWGTAQVLDATRARLAARGYRWHELPVLWDLDRPEDLQRAVI
ncbi:MAG: TIGR04282 family arsenosugar biosynthesis glycosyltransferase [Burkholderiales bacterium]|nr:TIGR04282 family arsenosugar biosynthesis glycosyltransferase [Burkholderiales bacterium]